MPKVFASVSMSLDGYVVPDGMDMEHADEPGYKNWMSRWTELQNWILQQKAFRENLGLGEGGETGAENNLIEETNQRTSVHIMGKRMFELGERMWPEEAPFHTPVFVLTHEERQSWKRPGGTTFHFVNDGIEDALALAQDAAGGKDIRVSGGAYTITQFLNAGLMHALTISLSPMLLGGGTALFELVDPDSVKLEISSVLDSPLATHLTYEVSGI